MSYDINSNILLKSGYNAEQLKKAEQNFSPTQAYHDDVWQAIVDAENKYGINALFILAHADVESAHGRSFYATTRNNLFGFNAIDSDPDQASSYLSQSASIDFYADFLKTHYLVSGGVYYNGATPHGVFVRYSSSHDSEANTVVQIMNALESHITGNPPQTTTSPAPIKSSSASVSVYTVKSGDTLSGLQSRYPGTTIDMWVNNNKSKYPSMTRDYIQVGWQLTIPGGIPAAQPQVESPVYRVAQSGDTVWAWGFRPPYSDFRAMNPGVNPDNIFVGKTYRIK